MTQDASSKKLTNMWSEKRIEKDMVDAAEAFYTDGTGKTVIKASTLSQ